MDRIETVAAMIATRRSAAQRGETIALVPTMGALHRGHLSLISAARASADRVVLSIFVNPTQFAPGEDFLRYPRDLEGDAVLAEKAGVDWLFAPATGELYPPGDRSFVEVRELGERLCGKSRPGHFRGVATVVAKLLAIVDADRAFFGEKDYQQLLILKRMAADLRFRTELVSCPTLREPDGLALSSRNAYLGARERAAATVLSRALGEVRESFHKGERRARTLEEILRARIAEESLARIDYAEVVDGLSLDAIEEIAGPAVAAVAVYISTTRLIDNVVLDAAAPEGSRTRC